MTSTINRSSVSLRQTWGKWFSNTSMYGFELFMAAFGLTIAAIVIDYGLFAFFNYLKGIDAGSASQAVGEFSLWIVAAMLVWLPLALGFYLRVRGAQLVSPERRERRLHKVIVSLHLFVNILLVAGASFAVLYSLIRMATGAGDMGVVDMLVRVTLPALLMAALHGWVLFAFSSWRLMRRKVFAMAFLAAAAVVMVGLLVASFGTVRDMAIDDKRERDLSILSAALSDHYEAHNSLPNSLNDLEIGRDELRLSLDDYTYDRQLVGRYELCATFAADTRYDGYSPDRGYSSYGNFTVHGEGIECFKLAATYSYFDDSGRPEDRL